MRAPITDTITILRCARGLRLAKVITPAGIADYDSTKTFDGWSAPVTGIADLHQLLGRLIGNPRLCVVRGALINSPAWGIRRLAYPDPKTGAAATLRDVPRQWLGLDVEGMDRPDDLRVADLEGCARFALQRLPFIFRTAACIVQATAGHGLKPDLRLRLWFWLSRPTSGQELSRWLRGAPADPSVFRPAQIIYTAAPVFEGCLDHLPSRIAMIEGVATVQVPTPAALAPPPRPEPRPLPERSHPGASKYAWTALRNAVAKIAAAPINSRHPTCLAQARNLARFVDAGLLGCDEVKNSMAEALVLAGKSREEGEDIALWALAHPSTTPLADGIA